VAAVAKGFIAFEIGTDVGGSVRVPSSNRRTDEPGPDMNRLVIPNRGDQSGRPRSAKAAVRRGPSSSRMYRSGSMSAPMT
jgi:hypothetical protein